MNMVTSFNSKDMTDFANHIKEQTDNGLRKPNDPITKEDVENFRILKSVALKESTTFEKTKGLHDFLFKGWVKDGKWNDYQNSKERKEFTFLACIENNGFHIEIVEEHSNLCNRIFLRSDGMVLDVKDIENPLVVSRPIN